MLKTPSVLLSMDHVRVRSICWSNRSSVTSLRLLAFKRTYQTQFTWRLSLLYSTQAAVLLLVCLQIKSVACVLSPTTFCLLKARTWLYSLRSTLNSLIIGTAIAAVGYGTLLAVFPTLTAEFQPEKTTSTLTGVLYGMGYRRCYRRSGGYSMTNGEGYAIAQSLQL